MRAKLILACIELYDQCWTETHYHFNTPMTKLLARMERVLFIRYGVSMRRKSNGMLKRSYLPVDSFHRLHPIHQRHIEIVTSQA